MGAFTEDGGSVSKSCPILVACLVAVTASCDATDPVTPPVADPKDSLVELELSAEAVEFYTGSVTSVYVRGVNGYGRLVDVDSAIVTSSDPSVVSLSGRATFNWRDENGNQARGLKQIMTMTSPGTAVLRASLSGVTDSLVVKVIPIPQVSSAIAIDSFTVLEYRARCAWDCPYLVYAPLLKVREATGLVPVYVLAVQFDVSTRSTGVCNVGQLRLAPGFTGHINSIDPYLWANDMILVQLDGAPLPPGSASVRVIFRDAAGNDGMIEATGEIQRMVRDPVLPTSPFAGTGWSCAFHHLGG